MFLIIYFNNIKVACAAGLEELHHQVYDQSSSDETSSDTSSVDDDFDYEDIDDIPLEVTQGFHFLQALDESLTKAFGKKKETKGKNNKKIQVILY